VRAAVPASLKSLWTLAGARVAGARASLRVPAIRVPAIAIPPRPGRAALAALAISPRAGRIALAVLATVVLATAVYLLWLRDSSLVAIEKVSVSGLSTKDAPRIREALTDAGRDMTTLHVRPEALERAVAAYPAITAVTAAPDFPHRLEVRVVERPPVAILSVPGEKEIPVAADGTLLEGMRPPARLPLVPLDSPAVGEAVRDDGALQAVRVAAAAPEPLAGRIEAVEPRPEEEAVVARLRDGPELLFGRAERLDAKWAAATATLADDVSIGARYIDLRLPERPAVGS